MWRKNRNTNGGGCTGVDLNRNWAKGFGGIKLLLFLFVFCLFVCLFVFVLFWFVWFWFVFVFLLFCLFVCLFVYLFVCLFWGEEELWHGGSREHPRSQLHELAGNKGIWIGHSVRASLWCVSLLINTRFRFLFFFSFFVCLFVFVFVFVLFCFRISIC